MIKIGFVMKKLLDPVVEKSNDFLESEESVDIIGFIQNHHVSEQVPGFALMNISQAYTFNGLLIATDLDSAEKIITFPGTKDKWFYISELEWVGQTQRTYAELSKIYYNDKLTLIASTDEIAKDIESLWGATVYGVIADFDVGEISETYKTLLFNRVY